MKYLNWDPQKNEILKQERGISFEEIAYLIESGQILGIEENPSRPNQKMYILEIDNYAIIVPYVENDNERGIQFYERIGYRIETESPILKTRERDFQFFKISKDL